MAVEQIDISKGATALHARLRSLGAEFQRDRSGRTGQVYYSRPLNKWVLVRAKGGMAQLTYHAECPCSMQLD